MTNTLTRVLTRPLSVPLGTLLEVRPGFGESVFDPSSLFADSEDGAFYDPSDLTSLYQSLTSGADIGVIDSPVGIMLDKRLMGGKTAAAFIAAQVDILTTSAVENGSWTYDSGTATVTAGGTAGSDSVEITLDTTVAAGSYCEITIPNNMPGSAFYVDFGGGKGCQVGALTSTNASIFTKPTASTTIIRVGRWAGAPSGTIGPITVREVPGNHLVAPSDATRPTLQATALTTAATTGGELVTNGDLGAGDLTGWSTSGDTTYSSGAIRVNSPDGSFAAGEQDILTLGKLYRIRFDVVSATGNWAYRVGTGNTIVGTTSTASIDTIQLCSGSTSFGVRNSGIGETLFDNVSVQEVVASNYLYYLDFDGVDDSMIATMPGLSNDCTVITCADIQGDTYNILHRGEDSENRFMFVSQDGNPAGASNFGVGTPTMRVDGADTALLKREELFDAFDGGPHIVGLSGADLSLWTEFGLSNYSGIRLAGRIYGSFVIDRDLLADETGIVEASFVAKSGAPLP